MSSPFFSTIEYTGVLGKIALRWEFAELLQRLTLLHLAWSRYSPVPCAQRFCANTTWSCIELRMEFNESNFYLLRGPDTRYETHTYLTNHSYGCYSAVRSDQITPRSYPPARRGISGRTCRAGCVLARELRSSVVAAAIEWRGPSVLVVDGRGCRTHLDVVQHAHSLLVSIRLTTQTRRMRSYVLTRTHWKGSPRLSATRDT